MNTKACWSHLLLPENLSSTVKDAVRLCKEGDEEKGGFILSKDGDYLFVPIANELVGTSAARGLYRAHKAEYGEKVVGRILQGWTSYASFHTHPNGYSPNPSSIDLQQLFLGHPINFIYATHTKQLVCYEKTGVTSKNRILGTAFDFTSLLVDGKYKTDNKVVLWAAKNVRLRT